MFCLTRPLKKKSSDDNVLLLFFVFYLFVVVFFVFLRDVYYKIKYSQHRSSVTIAF